MKKYLQDLFSKQQYDKNNFFLIAGPCVVESEELVMEVADKVSTICKNLGGKFIIVGNELRVAGDIDYERNQTIPLVIRTDDGHGGFLNGLHRKMENLGTAGTTADREKRKANFRG